MIKIADSFASINIGGGDKPGEVSSHSVVISTIPEEHEVPAVRPSRKEQWSRAERRAALRELLNNHPHETTDPPSFNFRSFLFHGLVHILFPWSMLVYLLVMRFVAKDRSPLRAAMNQALLFRRDSQWSGLGLLSHTFRFLLFSWAWPVLSQLVIVLAFLGYCPAFGRDEAVICFVLFATHRLSIGAKYGSLSERERRRLLSADVERAYKMQNRLQILTGWMQKPMDDTVLAEIELAAAAHETDLSAVWLDLAPSAAGARSRQRASAASPPSPDTARPPAGEVGSVSTRGGASSQGAGASPSSTRSAALRGEAAAPDAQEPAQESASQDGCVDDATSVALALIHAARQSPLARRLYPTHIAADNSAPQEDASFRGDGRGGGGSRPARQRINAGALAVSLAAQSFAITDRWIVVEVGTLFGAAALAFLPAATRTVRGLPPFGSEPLEKACSAFAIAYTFIGYGVHASYIWAQLFDVVRRGWIMAICSALIRLPPERVSLPQDDPGDSDEDDGGGGAAPRAAEPDPSSFEPNVMQGPPASFARGSRTQLAESLRTVPVLDMHDADTVRGWLALRAVVDSWAQRYRSRNELYFTTLCLLVIGDVAWQVSVQAMKAARAAERAAAAAAAGAPGAGQAPKTTLGMGVYVAIVLSVPTTLVLLAVVAAAARYNEQHAIQKSLLMHQRLLLRDRAAGAATAGGASSGSVLPSREPWRRTRRRLVGRPSADAPAEEPSTSLGREDGRFSPICDVGEEDDETPRAAESSAAKAAAAQDHHQGPGAAGPPSSVDWRADDMLRIAAKVVMATPRLRVFGFEASGVLLKGLLSALASAVVVIAGLASANVAGGAGASGGTTAAGGEL